eukprot:m.390902 g.390902  ORF g.390902 m.390902 type:complete len:338 (+) comp28305_c1_seq5:657-1670(+)
MAFLERDSDGDTAVSGHRHRRRRARTARVWVAPESEEDPERSHVARGSVDCGEDRDQRFRARWRWRWRYWANVARCEGVVVRGVSRGGELLQVAPTGAAARLWGPPAPHLTPCLGAGARVVLTRRTARSSVREHQMLRIGQDITAPKVRVGDEPTRLCRLRSANLHGGSTTSSSRGRRLLDCRLGLMVTTVLVEQLKRPPRRFGHTVFRHASVNVLELGIWEATLFKHVCEGPVRHDLHVLRQIPDLAEDERRGGGGIVLAPPEAAPHVVLGQVVRIVGDRVTRCEDVVGETLWVPLVAAGTRWIRGIVVRAVLMDGSTRAQSDDSQHAGLTPSRAG